MSGDEKLEITDKTFILGVWHAEQPEKQSMTFWVYKNTSHSENYIIKWITRDHNPESVDPFDRKDEKRIKFFSVPSNYTAELLSILIDNMISTGG